MNSHIRRAVAPRSNSDPMAAAMEFVVTPLLLGLLGWLLDGRLDTQPLFAMSFALVGIVGVGVSHYFRYMARMAREDEGKPWTRRPQ